MTVAQSVLMMTPDQGSLSRELAGESAEQFFPRESTLVILHRIRKKGRQLPNAS